MTHSATQQSGNAASTPFRRFGQWLGGGEEPPTTMPSTPPPPPTRTELTTENAYATLPTGWSTAVNPVDGRIYYWEEATGKTSWTHPLAQSAPPPSDLEGRLQHQRDMTRKPLPHEDNPLYASRRPDTHECNSFVALCLFPPLGIIAIYHTCSVNRAWNHGRYGDAVHHARQAPKYATLAIVVGIVFWIYWIFFREEGGGRWEWPKWEAPWGD